MKFISIYATEESSALALFDKNLETQVIKILEAWATNPDREDALKVLRRWLFRYNDIEKIFVNHPYISESLERADVRITTEESAKIEPSIGLGLLRELKAMDCLDASKLPDRQRLNAELGRMPLTTLALCVLQGIAEAQNLHGWQGRHVQFAGQREFQQSGNALERYQNDQRGGGSVLRRMRDF